MQEEYICIYTLHKGSRATARIEGSNTIYVLTKEIKVNPMKKADGILLFMWDSRDLFQRLTFSQVH